MYYLRRAGGLLLAVRQAAAGDARDRPTVFVGVPRVFEKIRQEVERQAALSPVKKRLLAWAVGVGAAHRDTVYDGRRPSSLLWKLADKLVYSKVREAFGGRVQDLCLRRRAAGHRHGEVVCLGGDRALGGLWPDGDLAGDCPEHAAQPPHGLGGQAAAQCGAASWPRMANCWCAGRRSLPATGRSRRRTRSASTRRDGSAPATSRHLDADGFLYITDRKKELLKTSGGKLVAPQPIENKLKNNLLVAQAALVGDRHKFISALISPNFAALEEWARQHGIAGQVARGTGGRQPRDCALWRDCARGQRQPGQL